MVTAQVPGPSLPRGHVLRTMAMPAALAAVGLVITAAVGHVLIGVFIAIGLGLGLSNGLLAELAIAKIRPEANPTKGMIVGGSMRRLGLITIIALGIAFLARPYGWTVLIGLAAYQIMFLSAALSIAAKEARQE